ncbi:hypothetical protein JTE90_027181 [Oedothorax gibbosus]|uniref:DUF4806 domain-containing protein n=1 Tax=Oedothorax gibbosus TaxID=931172 RepID=A0AAV6TQ10_9ARAC|nr:hypothetical protein JTE90_027181 [Oedothorax gibbosus]
MSANCSRQYLNRKVRKTLQQLESSNTLCSSANARESNSSGNESDCQYDIPMELDVTEFVDLSNNESKFKDSCNVSNISSEDTLTSFVSSMPDTTYINSIKDQCQASFEDELRMWALEESVSHKTLNKLLGLLKKHPCHSDLPSDARGLLKTPRETISEVALSSLNYIHLGIRNGIENILSSISHISISVDINLLVNIDGLPISKSSSSQLWPILGQFSLFGKVYTFVIGLYHGLTKPQDSNIYLKDFVTELLTVISNGIKINQVNCNVNLKSIVCDAPARAYVACIKGHTGYYGCGKCTQVGKFLNNRMCFPKTDAPLRTDESFEKQAQEEHHIKKSILLEIPNFGLVSGVPFEYMHLVCLGAMRKLLNLWIKGDLTYRMPYRDVAQISILLENIRPCIPKEFARKPRSLKELDRFKATEFRQLLLYTGPVVFKDILKQPLYEHFLTLHVAITILASNDYHLAFNSYADDLLKYFAMVFINLYGEHMVSYNIHGLVHLASDVLKFGPLDNFSAFGFENHLQQLKKLIRKADKPLKQIYNRLKETAATSKIIIANNDTEKFKLEMPHTDGILIDGCVGPEFQKIIFNSFTLTITKPNNCCILTDGTIIFIENVAFLDDSPVIVGRKFTKIEDFYVKPCLSSLVGIFKMDKFTIVVFLRTNEVDIVSTAWINQKDTLHCYWPPYKHRKLKKALASHEAPNKKKWTNYAVRCIETYDTYKEARANVKKSEYSSDLNSEIELGRGKRKEIPRDEGSSKDCGTDGDDSWSSDQESVDMDPKLPPPPPPMSTPQPSSALSQSAAESTPRQNFGRDTGFQAIVLRDLMILKGVSRQLAETLDNVVKVLANFKEDTEKAAIDLPLLDLPLQSEEQVDELDSKLMDTEFYNGLVKSLQIIGGINFENCVRRIMRKLMTDDLATGFSWGGCKGKRPFGDLTMSKAVFDAVRKNAVFQGKSDADIEYVIKNWLRHAKARSKYVKL